MAALALLLSLCPQQDFGIVPESLCVPGLSPFCRMGTVCIVLGCHPAPPGFGLSTQLTSVPFQILSACF